MAYFFSKQNGGFYNDAHVAREDMPNDAAAITDQQYQALFDGQAQGRLIQVTANGMPISVDPPVDLFRYANKKQWDLLMGGYTSTINGQAYTFSCDGQAAGFMASTVMDLSLPNPPDSNVVWQTMNGTFVSMAPADFVALARRIRTFGQNTFTMLSTCFDNIAIGMVATTDQVDAMAWPANHD